MLAQNIANQALIAGHTVLFASAGQLLGDLCALDSDAALRPRLRYYARPKLLVIDEVGYLSYSSRLRAAQTRRFSIGFVGSALYGDLPALIRRFRAMRPEVDVLLLEMTTLEQLVALKEGRIDAGFDRILFEDAAIHRHLLRDEPVVAAVWSGHRLLTQPGAVALSELAGETLIVYPKGHGQATPTRSCPSSEIAG